MIGCSRIMHWSSTQPIVARVSAACGAVEQGLGEFDVPVADLAPDKGVKRVRRLVEAIVGQRRVHLGPQPRAVSPMIQRLTVAVAAGGEPCVAWPVPHAVHLGEAAGVPELGAEVAVAGDASRRQLQVAPHRRHRGQREAHARRPRTRRSGRAGRARCRATSTSSCPSRRGRGHGHRPCGTAPRSPRPAASSSSGRPRRR